MGYSFENFQVCGRHVETDHLGSMREMQRKSAKVLLSNIPAVMDIRHYGLVVRTIIKSTEMTFMNMQSTL